MVRSDFGSQTSGFGESTRLAQPPGVGLAACEGVGVLRPQDPVVISNSAGRQACGFGIFACGTQALCLEHAADEGAGVLGAQDPGMVGNNVGSQTRSLAQFTRLAEPPSMGVAAREGVGMFRTEDASLVRSRFRGQMGGFGVLARHAQAVCLEREAREGAAVLRPQDPGMVRSYRGCKAGGFGVFSGFAQPPGMRVTTREGVGMLWTEDPSLFRSHRGCKAGGFGVFSGFAQPPGMRVTTREGVGMLWTEDPSLFRSHLGCKAGGFGVFSGFAQPPGMRVTTREGVGMLWTEDPSLFRSHLGCNAGSLRMFSGFAEAVRMVVAACKRVGMLGTENTSLIGGKAGVHAGGFGVLAGLGTSGCAFRMSGQHGRKGRDSGLRSQYLAKQVSEFRRCLRTLVRVLGQQAQGEDIEAGRNVGTMSARSVGDLLRMCPPYRIGLAVIEGRPSGEERIEQAAQGIQICALVRGVVGLGLFGSHVRRRTDELASTCDAGALGVGKGRDTEVEHFDNLSARACPGQNDVGWFHVSVHDTRIMGRREGVGDLGAPVHGLGDGQSRGLTDELTELLAIEQLHDDEWLAAVMTVMKGPVIEHGDDMSMTGQLCGYAGFALEAGEKLIGRVIAQEFDCYGAPQPDVMSTPYDPHAAGSQRLLQSVTLGQ
ncbi:hypothetical protein OH767_16050 [Streptomyces sp. NBC_01614]